MFKYENSANKGTYLTLILLYQYWWWSMVEYSSVGLQLLTSYI